MLTRLTIRGFKRFGSADIDLANAVVIIDPNNSGKTFAKNDYHQLARFVPAGAIDPDIISKLDAIAATADAARPTSAQG